MSDPMASSGFRRDNAVPQSCWRGHRWTARMFFEWGGWFYVDENEGQCPECGAWDDEPRPGCPRQYLHQPTVGKLVELERSHGTRGWQRSGFGLCLTWPQSSAQMPNQGGPACPTIK